MFHNLIISTGKLICSKLWWSIKIKGVYLGLRNAVYQLLRKKHSNVNFQFLFLGKLPKITNYLLPSEDLLFLPK